AQHDLVGRLVHTLLQGDGGGQISIHGPTLQRITADLNSRGLARTWLSQAQTAYSTLQFQLPDIKQQYWPSSPQDNTAAPAEVTIGERQGVL
ncbi:hypothetical protein DSI38_12405, partial [Mycobacterium tuberculosis]